jgi:hypothetical protein
MLPEQKRAWYVLAVFAAALVGASVLSYFWGWGGWGGLGLFALAGLSPLIFPKRRRPGEVEFDERDRMIWEKSALSGGMASYLIFIVACMGRWLVGVARGEQTMPILYLPFVVVAGAIALMVTHAIVTLVLYGREGDHGQD